MKKKDVPAVLMTKLDKAKSLVDLSRSKGREAIEAAVEAGQELIAIKQECEHGQFESVVKRYVGLAPATARRYMRAAKKWDEVKDEIGHDGRFDAGLVAFLDEKPKPKAVEFVSEKFDQAVNDFKEANEAYEAESLMAVTQVMEVAGSGMPIPDGCAANGSLKFATMCRYARANWTNINWVSVMTNQDARVGLYYAAGRYGFEEQGKAPPQYSDELGSMIWPLINAHLHDHAIA